MLLLAVRSLRARPARTVFTALAIALGVAMIFAMRIATVTLEASGRATREQQLAGADIEVATASGARLPAALVRQLAAHPEVEAAAPVLRVREGRAVGAGGIGIAGTTTLQGTGLTLMGIDPANDVIGPRGEQLAAGAGLSDRQAREVILPVGWALQHGVGVGDQLELTTDERTATYTVAGLHSADPSASLGAGGSGREGQAFVPLGALQAAIGEPDQANSIFVRLQPGRSREVVRQALQDVLGSQFVVVSAGGESGGLRGLFDLVNLALPFAGFAVLLGGSFLVFNAFAITLAERRREIGQLRTLGMTRRQVLGQTLAEAALTALLGVVVGLVLGWALGVGVTAIVRQLQGTAAVPQVPLPWDGALLAALAGMLVALAVTSGLAWQAAQVEPLEAMRPPEAARRRRGFNWTLALGLTGFGLLALTAVLVGLVQRYLETSSNPGLALLMTPILFPMFVPLLCLPLATDGLVAAWGRLAARGRLGMAAQLAAGSAGRQSGRFALTAAGLALGLSLIIFFAGFSVATTDFITSAGDTLFAADFVLVRSMPAGTSFQDITRLPAFPPFEPELQVALDDLETRADLGYLANISLPGLGVEAIGDQYGFALNIERIRGTPLFPVIEGSWDEAERIFAAGPALIVPEVVARRDGLHPGGTVIVETLRGRVPFTVALVGGGFPVVDHATAQEYLGSYPAFILVNARGDKGALRAELQELARRNNLTFSEDMASEMKVQMRLLLGPIVGLFVGLTSVVGVVAGLGVMVTLLASVLERQRELGTLRALGMSRAQVRGMVVVEAGLIGLAGSGVGALGGLTLAYVFVRLLTLWLEVTAGLDLRLAIGLPWPVALGAVFVGPAMTMLTALWPADRAASVNPAEAMRAEGSTGFLKPAAHLGPTGLRGFFARMPLAARLSLTTGLVFVAAFVVLTGLMVHYQRQLLEDNVLALAQRAMDAMLESSRQQLDQLPGAMDIGELNEDAFDQLRRQAGAQAGAIGSQLQGGASPYEFGLEYFLVTNLERRVLFGDQPVLLKQVLTDTVTPAAGRSLVRLTGWTGQRVFEATLPVENRAGQRLGYLQIGFSTEAVDNIVRDLVRGAVALMAGALVITIGLTVLLTRRALSPVAEIAAASQAVARGDLAQRVPEARWDELGQLARAFNQMVGGLKERERMRDLFGRYLSREVSEAVLKGRVSLQGERRTITCLYVDMRGSTAFAENRRPEEVMAALNEYFEVIILATEAHGGIVNRFVGDEAVCVFGAPTPYRDHAECGLQAALSMRDGLAYLNQKREHLGQPALRFGMGLNTGEVVAGATGSEERQEYTVIGDAMNTGARIQSLTKDFAEYDLLLSEFTLRALGPAAQAYDLADLGEAEMRGKSRLVRVYGVRR